MGNHLAIATVTAALRQAIQNAMTADGLGGTAQNLKGENFEFPKPKKKFVPREKVSKKASAAAAEGEAPAAGAPAAAAPEAPAKDAE